MAQIVTETGRQFTEDEAVNFLRSCTNVMLDPASSLVETARAATEMIYTFRALDEHITNTGKLPLEWWNAHRQSVLSN